MEMKCFRILMVVVLLGLLGAIFIAQGADGQDDVGVFRPSNRTWYYDYGHDGSTDVTITPWAAEGDIPVAGDFNGDGLDDVAVFRPSNRTWYYDYNHNGTTDTMITPWAAEGDLPVAGDFDGDGVDDVAVFRSSSRTWYYDYSHNGTTDATVTPWAAEGDLPIAGDFDEETAAPTGDAITSISMSQTSDSEADVIVSYTYTGSHGFPVYVGAWPTQGGVRAAHFDFDRAGIATPGSGTVTVHLTYTAASCIATDGIEVFIYTPFGMPGEPFLTRLFSQGLTWGCGEGGVLPPSAPSGPAGIELAVDRGCGPGGMPYNLGDPLVIEHRLMGRISAARGVETLVLRVTTALGRVVQDACSFSIASVSPELARVWTNKGCGAEAVFHHRERATIYYSVGAPVTRVRVFAINPRMGLVELTTAPLTNQSGQLELTVGPQLGDAVLVVAAVTPTHGVITSSCWVLMN
jgi:hypothetical protein